MLEDIPKVAEYGVVGGGGLAGLWLIFRAFIKKNVTEKAEISIYELQSAEIKRLAEVVKANHETIIVLTEKIRMLEIVQLQEALNCSSKISNLERTISTLEAKLNS